MSKLHCKTSVLLAILLKNQTRNRSTRKTHDVVSKQKVGHKMLCPTNSQISKITKEAPSIFKVLCFIDAFWEKIISETSGISTSKLLEEGLIATSTDLPFACLV